jgi:predicted transcriptional regulator
MSELTYCSMEPVFVDQLVVDVVVREHKYMKMTPAEKRHVAHGLVVQGLTFNQIADLMRVTQRTVCRLLSKPPPPTLDVDADGRIVDEDGQFVSVLADTLAV